MGRFLRNSKGMALILTILIISLIVALTVEFNRFMRSDLHAAVNLRDGIRFGYTAKSGFNHTLAVLLEDSSINFFDSLHETWADSKSLSENSADLFDEGRFEVKVSDHSGRIQINKLVNEDGKNYNDDQKGLLTRFLKSFGIEDEEADNIVDAIKDWIDADNEVTRFGAENAHYKALDKPYPCKNAPIEFLEELLLIRGITKELFYGTEEKPGISNFISPHGDGKININTAGLPVLKALSEEIDNEMVKDMDDYRMDEENEESLSNSNWYKSVPGMDDVNIPPGLLTTSSTFFQIDSYGQKRDMVKDKEGFKREWVTVKEVTAMVERKGHGFDILSWKIE